MAETYDPMDTDDQVQRRRQRKRHNPYDKSSDFTTRGFKEKQSDFTTKSWRGGSKSDSSSWRGGGYKRTSTSTRPRGYKIEIKNIHWQVSESELKELFRQAGELEHFELEFDLAGRSLGKAVAYYASQKEASRAREMYDKRLLDGMEIEVSLEGKTSILDRLGPAQKRDILDRLGPKESSKRGGRSGRSGRGGRIERPARVEDLDMELESYVENGQSDFDANAKRAVVSYADV